MWETIKEVLNGGNAVFVLSFILAVIVFIVIFIRHGFISIRTKHVKIGKVKPEREIIRRQVETAHEFIMSIEGKIPRTEQYGGYFTRYILERVYDKVIEWIMFNHITMSQMYVEDKQDCICNLVYLFDVGDDYKTPEFNLRMRNWTKELIEKLVQTRDLYSEV